MLRHMEIKDPPVDEGPPTLAVISSEFEFLKSWRNFCDSFGTLPFKGFRRSKVCEVLSERPKASEEVHAISALEIVHFWVLASIKRGLAVLSVLFQAFC